MGVDLHERVYCDCEFDTASEHHAGELGRAFTKRIWDLIANSEIEIVPFDELQVRAAAAAFDRYGKGIN